MTREEMILGQRARAHAHVHRWCRFIPALRAHRDDLLAEAQMALCMAADRYRPGSGTWNSCAHWGLVGHLGNVVRKLTGLPSSHAVRQRHPDWKGPNLVSLEVLLENGLDAEAPEPPRGMSLTTARDELIRRVVMELGQTCSKSTRYARATRAVEFFLATEFGGEKQAAVAGGRAENLRQRSVRVRRHFEAWCAELRAEQEAA